MRVNGHRRRSVWTWIEAYIVAVWSVSGCQSLAVRDSGNVVPAMNVSADLTASTGMLTPPSDRVIIDSPRGHDETALVAAPSSVETWIVHTRACEQKLGVDPWFTITIGRLDESGGPLHGADPEALLARLAGRPSVFFVHGNNYTYREAVKEAVKIRAVLESIGGLPPETVFIVFDWPSERVLPNVYLDLNEKSRRSRVASYLLARFLQTAPVGSKICLMGQSDGGRIVLTTLHLLSGAPMRAFWSEPEVQLSASRQDLRLRGVVLDAAAGHHWLNPGQRLDQALPTCESLLNLRNCGDYVLAAYVLGVYTGIRPALGRVGLQPHDIKNLGPLAARVEQINLYPVVGIGHTSFPEALAVPEIADRIAHYTSWRELSSSPVY